MIIIIIIIAKSQSNDSNFNFSNFIKNNLTSTLLQIDNEKLYEESFKGGKIIFLSYFRYNAIDWAARAHNIDCNYGGSSNKFTVDICVINNDNNNNNNSKISWLDRNQIKFWKLPFKYSWSFNNQSKDEKDSEDDDNNEETYLKLTNKDDVLNLFKDQYKIAFEYSINKYKRVIYELNEDELKHVLKKASEGILYLYIYLYI